MAAKRTQKASSQRNMVLCQLEISLFSLHRWHFTRLAGPPRGVDKSSRLDSAALQLQNMAIREPTPADQDFDLGNGSRGPALRPSFQKELDIDQVSKLTLLRSSSRLKSDLEIVCLVIMQVKSSFLDRYTEYAVQKAAVEELRALEYSQLDIQQQVYLDNTGSALASEKQVRLIQWFSLTLGILSCWLNLCICPWTKNRFLLVQIADHASILRSSILGNPHSSNPTSTTSDHLAEQARHEVK